MNVKGIKNIAVQDEGGILHCDAQIIACPAKLVKQFLQIYQGFLKVRESW
jgi:hypothetical protein